MTQQLSNLKPFTPGLDQLEPSPRNVRRSTPSKISDAELQAGIEAVGILHPLIVVANGEERYQVIAGKRRLRAIKALAKKGVYADTVQVPCMLAENDATFETLSAIENMHREQMHPADEYEAFAKLAKNGCSADDIAATFGEPVSKVQKRLRLGQLAPAILKAYRANQVSDRVVQAYTLSTDKKRQLEVFEATGGANNANQVRDMLTNDTLAASSAVARFVGLGAYKKAGGSYSEDLFADELYLHDPAIINELATAKLERAAKKLGDAWGWIEINLEQQPITERRLTAKDTEKSKPIRAELDQAEEKLAALEQVDIDELDDDAYREHDAECDAAEAAIKELEQLLEASQGFKAKEQELAGCRVSIDGAGKLHIVHGLVRKRDEIKLAKLQGKASKGKGNGNQAGNNETEGEELSATLATDLETYRLNIAKEALASQPTPDLARLLLEFSFCSSVLIFPSYNVPIALNADETGLEKALAKPDTSQAYARLVKLRDALALEWMLEEDLGQRFRAFAALHEEDRGRVLQYCVAMCLKTEHGNKAAEIAIAELRISWHNRFAATADNYLGRIPKSLQIRHGLEVLPAEWAEEAEKRTRKQLAEDLEAVFAGDDKTMPTEKRAEALDWVPPAFSDRAEPLS